MFHLHGSWIILRLSSPSRNEVILQKQTLNSRSEECLYRLSRCVDDRLTLHIEACVQDHFTARGFPDRFQQRVEIAIVACRDGLNTRAPIDMGNGRESRPILLA